MKYDSTFLGWGIMAIVGALIQFFFTDAILKINKRIIPKASYELIGRFVPFTPGVLRRVSVVALVLGVIFLFLALYYPEE